MSDMRLREALAMWALTVTLWCFGGYLFDGISGLHMAAYVGPWVGLLATILYINYRKWGHPLQFTPGFQQQ